jgi:tetratricopeptide (TPR) repeat protein
MTRQHIDRGFWIAFLAAIAVIVAFWPSLLGVENWTRAIWVVCVLLSTPILYYLLARNRYPDAFPERTQIKPFSILHSRTTYDGAATARLLELEMRPSDPSIGARSRFNYEQSALPLSLAVAGTTIPMQFIWERFERWMFGPLSRIEGLISEDEGTVRIVAWCPHRDFTWHAVGESRKGGDPLRPALRDLADQIRNSFRHFNELVVRFERQARYDEAIYYCRRIDATEQLLTLAYLFYNAGRLSEVEDALEQLFSSTSQELRNDAVRCLALARAGQGRFEESLKLLDSLQGAGKERAVLDAALIHMYRKQFEPAARELERLGAQIEDTLNGYLGEPRKGMPPDAVASNLDKLDGKDWARVYQGLSNLEDLYGLLGRWSDPARCHDAIEVIYQLSVVITDDAMTIRLGARFEDLGEYENALAVYDNCMRATRKKLRDDPEDVIALSNVAWASAGKISCYVNRLRSLRNDGQMTEERMDDAQNLSLLLNDVEESSWWPVMVGVIAQRHDFDAFGTEAIRPISSLGKEKVEELLAGVATLSDIPDSREELRQVVDVAAVFASLRRAGRTAQKHFELLTQRAEPSHAADGYFGLACIDALCGHEDNAMAYLAHAIDRAPHFRNRARLDTDLASLAEREDFNALLQWPGEAPASIAAEQHAA